MSGTIGAVIAFVFLIGLLRWLVVMERRYYLIEYLFFIRYPLLLGMTIVALPIAGPQIAPSSLANIFVIRPFGVAMVSFFAFLAAWTIVHTGRLIWITVPWYCALPFRRPGPGVQEPASPPADQDIVSGCWWWLATALALPVVLTAAVLVAPPAGRFAPALAVAAGFVGALLVRALARALERTACRSAASGRPVRDEPPSGRLKAMVDRLTPFRELPSAIRRRQTAAMLFLVCSVVVYIAVGALACPAGPLTDHVPALAYLLILLLLLAWILGGISMLCDRSRLPGASLAVLLLILWQSIVPNTHVFRVKPWPEGVPLPRADDAIHARWQRSGSDVLVAVAAGGGGITAALWTATVLEGLHAEIPGFGERVALSSSVSGGGIAAMYYAESFTEKGPPSADQLKLMSVQAAAPSLDAAVWGMAYPDLWRFIPGSWFTFTDRGWAVEQRWRRYLPGPDRRFSDWAPGIAAGWRPLQIFNSTLQETGERFLIAGADLSPEYVSLTQPRMRLDLAKALFKEGRRGDISLTTGARLSATFPFVSPQARPEPGAYTREPGLHCADGGYFDNSGMYTALEVLGDYLDAHDEERLPVGIAVIEIRAANTVDEGASATRVRRRGGLINAIVGPLETLYNARVSTQIARSASEFGLIEKRWLADHEVIVRRFVFHLTDRLPLSWNLTVPEQALIRAHWPHKAEPPPSGLAPTVLGARNDNRIVLDDLIRFLANPRSPAMGTIPDPAQKADR